MKMKVSTIILAFTALVFNVHADSSTLPAPMPQFMNKEQLVKWNAEQAATYKPVATEEEPPLMFFTGKPYIPDAGGYVYKYRTYNPEMSRWTTADPSGFPDGVNNQSYAPTPTQSLDPSGLTTVTVTGSPMTDVSGTPLSIKVIEAPTQVGTAIDGESKVQWQVASGSSGWIVQHITFSDGDTYWEGWQVVNGIVYIGAENADGTNIHHADTFNTGVQTGTSGTYTITGQVGFFTNINPTTWTGTDSRAGSLPNTPTAPTGWSTTGTFSHTLTLTWSE